MNRQATLIGTSPGSVSALVDDTVDSRGEDLGGEADRWAADAAVRVGSRVSSRDGEAGRVSRLLRDAQSHLVTHFVVRTRSLFGRELIVPVRQIAEVAGDRVLLDVDAKELDKLPTYRTDEEIDGDFERALSTDEDLRRSGWVLLEVSVRDAVVTLRGYVPNRRSQGLAAEIAGRIRGVLGFRDQLVADDDLEVRVARALADDARTRPFIIRVHASQGIVHLTGTLEGTVASAETQVIAQEIAANVAGARSADVDFPATSAVEPPLILPGVGLPVCATDGTLGHLELVVMEPRSRRVTDLVVVGHFPPDRRDNGVDDSALEMRRLLVPARAVARVTQEAILLGVDCATATRFADYHEDDHRVPEHGWQSSFDYRREDVRFAAEPGSNPQPGLTSLRRAWVGAPRG